MSEMTSKNITLIFEKQSNTKTNNFVPKNDIPCRNLTDILPSAFTRSSFDLPDIPEITVVRHYIGLSQKSYGVDNGILPLGSCTMKYNPKINEITSRLPGFAQAHPLQEENSGSLELMQNLKQSLCEIAGMDEFTLYPAGGAQGELCGILVMKKYFELRGEKRNKIIVPDSAHGTNPASAAMAGFSIIELQSNEKGELPLDQLEFAMKGGDVAGLMLTNPNTLGLFDPKILQITEIVHNYGGLCYYDGANMNPMLGVCRPGDMGFDIIHLNLHKTFATPHGGGGPGAGPVGVKSHLSKYLPCDRIEMNAEGAFCSINEDKSIGRLHSFWGNFGVLIRAYTYIKALGAVGLRNAGQIAVLNANYIRVHLQEKYHIPFPRINMHEFVMSDHGLPNEITAEDIAKRLLDYGVYAPTIYFPLIVHGAMMIEPTETESKASLDHFIEIYMKIYDEIVNHPELLKNAPQNTSIGRLDTTLAARKPILHDEHK